MFLSYYFSALKDHNSNKYYLNGDWVIDLPRGYKIAGTKFYYKRPKRNQRFNEAIVSDGPTKEALDLMVRPGSAVELIHVFKILSKPPYSYNFNSSRCADNLPRRRAKHYVFVLPPRGVPQGSIAAPPTSGT
jgi:hypothetical protein